jgi:hypothetical protein
MLPSESFRALHQPKLTTSVPAGPNLSPHRELRVYSRASLPCLVSRALLRRVCWEFSIYIHPQSLLNFALLSLSPGQTVNRHRKALGSLQTFSTATCNASIGCYATFRYVLRCMIYHSMIIGLPISGSLLLKVSYENSTRKARGKLTPYIITTATRVLSVIVPKRRRIGFLTCSRWAQTKCPKVCGPNAL